MRPDGLVVSESSFLELIANAYSGKRIYPSNNGIDEFCWVPFWTADNPALLFLTLCYTGPPICILGRFSPFPPKNPFVNLLPVMYKRG
jgi:hypothetical protein